MVSQAVRRISETRTPSELEGVLVALCGELGFVEAAYYRLSRLGSPISPTLVLGQGFEPWISIYAARRYAAVDPVIPLVFRRDLPFTVREVESEFPEPEELHADRRRHWAPDGLFCPVATSWGEVGVVAWAALTPISLAAWDRLAMGNISRAVVTQLKQLSPVADMPSLPLRPLTRRESECAFWAAQGKRANEIATILGLSVHTVRQYLDSAIQKLGARNLGEMLLRGAALGLIAERDSTAA
jgi:DNA-binding CsgD family transcriptional regulator